jgi:hypothetical protein
VCNTQARTQKLPLPYKLSRLHTDAPSRTLTLTLLRERSHANDHALPHPLARKRSLTPTKSQKNREVLILFMSGGQEKKRGVGGGGGGGIELSLKIAGGYGGIVLPAGVEITCTERGRKGLGERES